jgi:hypothetical protein
MRDEFALGAPQRAFDEYKERHVIKLVQALYPAKMGTGTYASGESFLTFRPARRRDAAGVFAFSAKTARVR